MGCSNVYGNIGFMEEEEFPVELMDACLDFFAHRDSADLTYLGQRSPGHYSVLVRDTFHPIEIYLVDLTRRPPRFEKLNLSHQGPLPGGGI